MTKHAIPTSNRFREVLAMARLKIKMPNEIHPGLSLGQMAPLLSDEAFCFAALQRVSRSFALVIQQLPESLRRPVCLFYLVLRGLDTVEDDMNLALDEKLSILDNFHLLIHDPDWCMWGVGDSPEYRDLIHHFDKVNRTYLQLDESYQVVIRRICREMSKGMRHYAQRGIQTTADYDEYCYYVAGLVGYGLSDLFVASGLERPELSVCTSLSNAMGLFLQKTNITRDIREDVLVKRYFWPAEIYTRFVQTPEELIEHPHQRASVNALNAMVCDALRHFPDSLLYLQKLQDEAIFRFCAIPQLMALYTLAELYNQPLALVSTLKIRKGLTARIFTEVRHMDDFNRFSHHALDMLRTRCSQQSADHLPCLQLVHTITQTLQPEKSVHPFF